MNYFEQKLKTILEDGKNFWISPDCVYGDTSEGAGGTTFIDFEGRMLYSDNHGTHHELSDNDHELYMQTMSDRDALTDVAILGRSIVFEQRPAGRFSAQKWNFIKEYPAYIISFWGADITESEINAVVPKILEIDGISPSQNIDIYTSSWPTGINKLGSKTEKRESTPERDKEYELQRQLHLMRPEQKKAAMKKLGLDSKGKPSAGQRADLTPGQKYWAMSSEDKE